MGTVVIGLPPQRNNYYTWPKRGECWDAVWVGQSDDLLRLFLSMGKRVWYPIIHDVFVPDFGNFYLQLHMYKYHINSHLLGKVVCIRLRSFGQLCYITWVYNRHHCYCCTAPIARLAIDNKQTSMLNQAQGPHARSARHVHTHPPGVRVCVLWAKRDPRDVLARGVVCILQPNI